MFNFLTRISKRSISISLGQHYDLYKFTKRRKNVSKRSIFNKGELLQAVQSSEVFPDEGTFLEKKLLYPVEDVLDNFYNLKKEYCGTTPPSEALLSYIFDNFEDKPATEEWIPPDWTDEPDFIGNIKDTDLKNWAIELNKLWRKLGRKVTTDVLENPNLYASYSLPNGFITTDPRKSSMYYWSSYWILNGLLVCGMFNTARGMIENLLYMMRRSRHIPMCSQIYYEGRSSLPMLALIFESYLKYSGDFDFIQKNMSALLQELEFWDEDRTVIIEYKGKTHSLYRYWRKAAGPRPESYREDEAVASLGISNNEMLEKYIAIQSAVESGWYYSSRWVNVRRENKGNVNDTYTQSIIPVDLNAILHKSIILISNWFEISGDYQEKYIYQAKAKELLYAIEQVLWNKRTNIWLDYDIINTKVRNYFYLSNFTPLWTGSYTFPVDELTKSSLKYLNRFYIDKYEGGLPASVEFSGEKWDFPNAWPPLQAYIIQGFDNLRTEDGTNIAHHFAEKWINSVYKGYKKTGQLYEKYDSMLVGDFGDNHPVTDGYGWTLGLVFELLERYGPSLRLMKDYLDG